MSSLPARLVQFRDELEAAIRREQEAQARRNGVLHRLGRRPGRIVLAFAVVAGAAVAALSVSAPWQSSPGFLERAQAALTTTGPSILHMKWDTWAGTFRECGPDEIWLDQLPPHRYRSLVDVPRYFADAEMRKPVCTGEPPIEVGGTQNTVDGLEFRPPNMLIPVQLKSEFPVDPVADLREAIDAGRAHDEGTTELDGRTVRRIRLDPSASCLDPQPGCPTRPTYVYVDPETFYPVAMEGPVVLVNLRAAHLRIRYLEFEYLPRTAENLALTDIRAQHPNAIGP